VRGSAFPRGTSPPQEAILRRAADRLITSLADGTLTRERSVPLGLAWNGQTGPLGWAGLARRLPPDLRGPLAFVLGHRALRRGSNADAKRLFRDALSDAPPGSDLGREDRAGLDLANGFLPPPGNPFAPPQPPGAGTERLFQKG